MNVKIKKLKIVPSAGKVFYRVYERGNPGSISALKEEIKEKLFGWEGGCALFYAARGDDFVFAGKIYGVLPDGKIGGAIASEIFSKMKKVMIQILMRDETNRKTSFDVSEIPPAEAASFLGLEVDDFVEKSTAGVVRALVKGKE